MSPRVAPLILLAGACTPPAYPVDSGMSVPPDSMTADSAGDSGATEDTAVPRDTACRDLAADSGTAPDVRPPDAQVILPSAVSYARQLSADAYSPGLLVVGDPGYDLYLYAYGDSCELGGVYLLSLGRAEETDASASALGWMVEDGTCFGWSITSGSDLDGDGLPEVAIGAPQDTTNGGAGNYSLSGSGKAVLITGAQVNVMSGVLTADATLFGDRIGQELGSAIASLPDINGDGTDELLVAGTSAWLVHGGAIPEDGTLLAADAWIDRVDGVIAVLGDVDGDGLSEVAGHGNCGEGSPACIWSGADIATGPVSGTDAIGSIPSEGPTPLSTAGDTDGDGYVEFFVGGDLYRGRRVIGHSGALDDCDTVRFYTSAGYPLSDGADARDLDQDGRADVSLRYPGNGPDPSRVYVFTAASLPWVGSVSADLAWDTLDISNRFTGTPSFTADVDGDYLDELLGFDIYFRADGTYSYSAEIYRYN